MIIQEKGGFDKDQHIFMLIKCCPTDSLLVARKNNNSVVEKLNTSIKLLKLTLKTKGKPQIDKLKLWDMLQHT